MIKKIFKPLVILVLLTLLPASLLIAHCPEEERFNYYDEIDVVKNNDTSGPKNGHGDNF